MSVNAALPGPVLGLVLAVCWTIFPDAFVLAPRNPFTVGAPVAIGYVVVLVGDIAGVCFFEWIECRKLR